MRDLARNVVQDMSFRDPVGESRAQPGWDGPQVTEELAVKRRESTTGECELGGTVMGNKRVSVLEECNQDQPVVNPGRRT